MKQFFTTLFVWATIFSNVNAQSIGIGTNTPAASAQLDVSSTTKGLLIPRMTTAQRIGIAAPVKGLMVFDNDSNSFWFFNGSVWASISGAGASGWGLTGNSATVDGTNFIGTLDNAPLNIRVNNEKAGSIDHLKYNTFFGYQAGKENTTGFQNTATGMYSLLTNTTGSSNTANGYAALFANTTGGNNTAFGMQALSANTTGNANTANGKDALRFNTTGSDNTAIGFQALFYNTVGINNTANGYQALFLNTTGGFNTANGKQALRANTTGFSNTANGFEA